ncbi:MAG TPA: HlyD family secretion protein [Reyranellaceae bacterium]|nr:HlyD family secretion protein [Reyranellaceae bacterium]
MDTSIPSAKTAPPVNVPPVNVPPVNVPPVSPAPVSTPQISPSPRGPIWTRGRGNMLLRPRFIGFLVLLLLGIAYGGREVWHRFTHVYEYDARVTADVFTISSRTEGWIVEMPTLEGTKVAQGQIVVRLDDRAAKFKSDGLRAQLAAVQAERDRLRAERKLSEGQVEAKMRTRTSSVAASEKALAALKSDLDLARLELDRNRSLYQGRVVGERQLQQAQAAVTKLESQIQQYDAERQAAEGSLEEARAERDKLAVIDAQIAALDHQASNIQAQLAQQTVDVEDRTIRSPVPAVITRTFALPGEYVAPGQRILLLYNPEEVWVEANIKETQVGRLKLGQTVHVSVDAYPDHKFVGKVSRIGSATTARFALLPTPNPSGNFTKITQRVPVKINLVDMPRPLSPGMMVEVDIDVR